VVNDLVAISKETLTPAQFAQLADVPPELEWLANITNPKTRRAYKADVEEFSRFARLNAPVELRGVSRAHVIAWRKTLEARNLTPASIRRKLSALSSLFDYLCERNAVAGNPVDGVKRPAAIVLNRVPTAWEQYRWRIIGIVVLLILQSLLIAGLLINKRQREHAKASLRDMTGQLLRFQDEERRRIARDLHDGTGQHLSAITLALSQVLTRFPAAYSSLRKLLEDSLTSSRAALDEVRSVSYVLHSPTLDHRGLIPALRWYLEGIQRRTPLTVSFLAPACLSAVPSEVERTLFRIVQECISNVLGHSGATQLRVSFSDHNGSLQLEVEDNGKGMSPDQLKTLEGDAQMGVGVSGMRERVRQFDGDFGIESGSSGTRVTVVIPPQHKDLHGRQRVRRAVRSQAYLRLRLGKSSRCRLA
jgi:signal transduction histidine kinase